MYLLVINYYFNIAISCKRFFTTCKVNISTTIKKNIYTNSNF